MLVRSPFPELVHETTEKLRQIKAKNGKLLGIHQESYADVRRKTLSFKLVIDMLKVSPLERFYVLNGKVEPEVDRLNRSRTMENLGAWRSKKLRRSSFSNASKFSFDLPREVLRFTWTAKISSEEIPHPFTKTTPSDRSYAVLRPWDKALLYG
ncbi:hypothetical protein Tco_0809252 [Tanacetum coccineum]